MYPEAWEKHWANHFLRTIFFIRMRGLGRCGREGHGADMGVEGPENILPNDGQHIWNIPGYGLKKVFEKCGL